MRIIALKNLREFWTRHPQAEIPLRGWYAEVSHAEWKTPADIKAILDEADADPRSAENMFRSSFSGTPLKPADAHGSGTPSTTPPNAIRAPSPLFKREDLNTHVPYQASRAL